MKKAASALARGLAMLDLFEGEQADLTIEEMAQRLGVSARTVYRDVRTLRDAGFLDPTANAGYTLGPAFVHFDWLLRKGDGLIRCAAGPMRRLLDTTRQEATVVLCRRYRDCVMCIHQEHGLVPHESPVYERGVSVPIFAGATSKAILAHLSSRGLKRIYLENEAQIRAASRQVDWKSFSAELARIRSQGYALTISELRPGSVGIASPILREDQVMGSLALIFRQGQHDTDAAYREYGEQVKETAREISAALMQLGNATIARQ